MQEDNNNFDWIIGASTLGDDSLRAIAELKWTDKSKSRLRSPSIDVLTSKRYTINMNTSRTTIYLSPSIRKALRKRIIDADQTMSEYVDRAVAQAIAEDLEDIEAVEARRGGGTETLDDFLKALHQDGLI